VASGHVLGVTFSPDGRSVAVASEDHTVSVWDVRSRTRLGDPFGPYPGTVPEALFESGGGLLINLLSDGIEWPMNLGAWERFACQVAGRDLTTTEWHDVLPNQPYRHVCRQ
jgi:WD40 repeat protein